MHDHQQLRVVASPVEKAPPETVHADWTLEEGDGYNAQDDVDWQQQYQPSAPFHRTLDEPTFNMFVDHNTPTPTPPEEDAGQHKRFDTPRPPSDPYFQQQQKLFQGYYSTNRTPNNESNNQNQPQQLPNEPNHQPRRDTELFEALNEHIEALDEQMQTSSLRSVIDENFPAQPEMEYEYDVQDGYFQVEEGYETSQSQSEFESIEEAHGSFYASQSMENSYEAVEQYQAYDQNDQTADQIPDTYFLEQPQQPSEQAMAMRQELERLAAEKRAAEEAARHAVQERERERLEHERLDQERLVASRAEAARVEQLQHEKEDLEKELARQKAEQYRRLVDANLHQKPMSAIVKCRHLPTLPETNDPLELLGLDYRNPPETFDDLRRAFLKMAKKFHPDAVVSDATRQEREAASLNFAKINSAYQLLKDKQERLGDEYFAVMLGGPMYDSRSSRSRRGGNNNGFDDYGSMFSGNSYSATYGARHRQPRPQNGSNRNPFSRTNRQEAGDNCHVSGHDEDWW